VLFFEIIFNPPLERVQVRQARMSRQLRRLSAIMTELGRKSYRHHSSVQAETAAWLARLSVCDPRRKFQSEFKIFETELGILKTPFQVF
jgi:hypothetical protein